MTSDRIRQRLSEMLNVLVADGQIHGWSWVDSTMVRIELSDGWTDRYEVLGLHDTLTDAMYLAIEGLTPSAGSDGKVLG